MSKGKDIPPNAHKSIAEHKEAIEQVLDQLDNAAASNVKRETRAMIAQSVRGAALALVEDAQRLRERADFFEHYNRGPTKPDE
jgi:hypothetical protein